MALKKTERTYEILIRLHQDDSVGAHYKNITEIIDDGKVISAKEGGAMPLDINSEVFTNILGSACNVALAENAELKLNCLKYEKELEALRAQNENLKNLAGMIEDANDKIEELDKDLQEKKKMILDLQIEMSKGE